MFKPLFLLASLVLSTGVFAKCEVTISANDAMAFSTKQLEVDKSCKTVTLTLNHTGKLPANVVGHNWVLSVAADVKELAMTGMQAGLENRYLPKDDPRVLASTEVIGGGETTSIEFSTENLNAGTVYKFFCSFPGHFAIMQGDFKLI